MFELQELIPKTWLKHLESCLELKEISQINSSINADIEAGIIIHPPQSKIFEALHLVPFDLLKVVILGQDPYHGQGQAMGLSFSVPKGIKIPPSLRNIYRELMTDEGMEYPMHGDLTSWAHQGVLLLNAILTVQHKMAASHSKIGWEAFTNKLIETISTERDNIVFMLWGNYARSKKELIDCEKHLVLEAAHPSPLARDKFQGCKHFSKTNAYLAKHNQSKIDWNIV